MYPGLLLAAYRVAEIICTRTFFLWLLIYTVTVIINKTFRSAIIIYYLQAVVKGAKMIKALFIMITAGDYIHISIFDFIYNTVHFVYAPAPKSAVVIL